MRNLHDKLRKIFSWYDWWHSHPRHHYTHWLVFVSASLAFTSYLSIQILLTYPATLIQAQTTTLSISGNRFAINGQQKFLVLATYFDGLDSPNPSADLDYLKSKGFDGIRIGPNWQNSDRNGETIMNADGSIRQTRLAKLKQILDRATALSMVVDITFMREGVDGPCPAITNQGEQFDIMCIEEYKNGVVSAIRSLSGYNNIIYDLQNEASGENSITKFCDYDVDDPSRRCIERSVGDNIRDLKNRIKNTTNNTSPLSASYATTRPESTFLANQVGLEIVNWHWPFGENLNQYKNSIAGSNGSSKPTYMGEPYHTNYIDRDGATTQDLIISAVEAKKAGLSAWIFHSSGPFNLDGRSLSSTYGDIEKGFLNYYKPQLDATPWGGGGALPPVNPSCTLRFSPKNIMPGQITTASWSLNGPDFNYYCTGDLGSGLVPYVMGAVNVTTSMGQTCSLRVGSDVICSDTISVSLAEKKSNIFNKLANIVGQLVAGERDIATALETNSIITLSKTGTGKGTISDNFGNACDIDCPGGSASYPANTNLTLEATAVPGSTFTGWSGDCAPFGSQRYCSKDMSAARNVTANFNINVVGQPPPPGPEPQATDEPNPCPVGSIIPGVLTICDFAPSTVRQGGTVNFTGSSLSGSQVVITSSTRQETSIAPTINGNGAGGSFRVPANIPNGDYNVGLSSNTGSAVASKKLTVISNLPSPTPDDNTPPGNPPPFNPPSTPIAPPPATNFQELISFFFNYSIILIGIAVFIVILWAGFLWVTSAANPANISRAKGMIFNAVIGAVLLLSSYVILYTINPELVGGTFKLPRIKTTSTPGSPTGTSFVALDEIQAASAIQDGCTIRIDAQNFTSVDCPSDSTGSGLTPNPILETTDQGANSQIGASAIHSSGNLGDSVKIVVLDTGYNQNHPELRSSYRGGKDFINKDNDPTDDHTSGIASPGHGSHVAGIITADGIDPRSKGVAPQAEIIAGKILDSRGNGNWDYLVDAIYWAVDNYKPDIINISIGGGSYSSFCDNSSQTNQLLLRAFQYAKNNGALPIVSAGNTSGRGVSMPGCISEAFTVGAVDSSDRIANFSGQGATVDIVAPGVGIYSSLLGNNYGTKQGTSMATPVVSGVAALIKSAHPEYNAYDLEKALTATVRDLGSSGKDNTYGWGRVTAIAADSGSQPIPPPQPIPPNPAPLPKPVPPQKTCVGNICGEIWPALVSCTKGTIQVTSGGAKFGDCDVVLDYRVTGTPLPSSIIIKRNGAIFKTITCGQTCNIPAGTQIDSNPSAGTYIYTLHIGSSTGAQIGATTVYVYSQGTLRSDYNSCTKGGSTNSSCDVVLNYTTTGVNPRSLVVRKDGQVWQTITCGQGPGQTCNIPAGTLTDSNPSTGIHTYTIHDSSDGSRLARVIVTVN